MTRFDRSLCWFRRDLRDYDHAALYHALKDSRAVFCAFVFDREILDPLQNRRDRRVEFIFESVQELAQALSCRGGGLIMRHGPARSEIPHLAAMLEVQAVFANHDYEPQAIERDRAVARELEQRGIAFHTVKDQVIFERDELVSSAGQPFIVLTPYKNAWLKQLSPFFVKPYPVEAYARALARPPTGEMDAPFDLARLGFERTNLSTIPIIAGMSGGAQLFKDFETRVDAYRERRDYPAQKGPSYLSVHLRFGTVSIRQLAAFAHGASLHRPSNGAATWLTELIWRDFFAQILFHHPRVVDHAFRPEFDRLPFRNDRAHFAAWCEGRTGYPLIDAAMRQINATGYMHNRLRMVVASFLSKDLLIDWRWGERYFAEHLNDYDLASNNGGWQWAARPDATRSRTFACSIRSCNRSASMPAAASFAVTFPSSRRSTIPRSMRRGSSHAMRNGRAGSRSGGATPRQWSITLPHAGRRSRCSKRRESRRGIEPAHVLTDGPLVDREAGRSFVRVDPSVNAQKFKRNARR